ncbi:diguanylate cyclase domain-containing protein, partial [Weizmannia acidilactici]
RFKHINDTFGHDVGDELLKQFTNRVQSCIRESDILVRWGGDEFIILLSKIENEKQVTNIAERIIFSLQSPWNLFGQEFKTTSSIGIAFYEEGDTEKELLKKADIALYQAKSEGKNTFCFYHRTAKEKSSNKKSLL